MDSREIAHRMLHGNRLIAVLGISLFLVVGHVCPPGGGIADADEPANSKASKPDSTPATVAVAATDKPAVKIVDEHGDPLAKFELRAWTYGQGNSKWHSGTDGKIAASKILSAIGKLPAVALTVRADGYASTLRSVSGAELEKLKAGDTTIVMHRGEEVEIGFRLPEGMTWPKDLKPELCFFALQDAVRAVGKNPYHGQAEAPDANMLNAQFDRHGTATLRLSSESAPICVAIHAPGFLQFFEYGPLNLAKIKNGKLEIAIDKPAALDVAFDSGEAEKSPFGTTTISLQWKNPATHRMLEVASSSGPKPAQELKLADLPTGEYLATIRAFPKPGASAGAVYTASKTIQLAAGQSERIELPYTPPDPNAFRGERTAIVHILKPDGSPLTGEKVTVSYHDEHYVLPVFADTIPSSGILKLEGITDRKPEGVRHDPYTVNVAGKQLGYFGFTNSNPTAEFTFRVPAVVGDIAPDVPLVNVDGGAPAKLSDFRGKVVLVEFWATWCGPCQEPMAKMNRIVADKPEVWKEQAVIVPISIDNTTDVVTTHVNRRGWTNLQYYWSSNEGAGGWQSPAPQAFGINGVPTSFILDRQGKIIWTGHPADTTGGKDIEARVEEAIAR